MSPIKAIVFDLGKVLIYYSFDRAFQKWEELTKYPSTLFKSCFNYEDPTLYAFEKGEISPYEYFDYLTKEIGVNWTYEQFKEGWIYVNIGVNSELYDLLDEIKERYPLYVLSNTNELHAQDIALRFSQLFSYFRKSFFSQNMHSRKPDKEIFQKLMKEIKLKPDEILFIDDLGQNVDSAKNLGINAIQMISNEQLLSDLMKYKVINPNLYIKYSESKK